MSQINFAAIWPGFAPRKLSAEKMPRDIALLVRDMFRVFQLEQGEARFPDEAALAAYPQDLNNYRLKMAENHYLIRAVTDNSMMDLQQFVLLREARRRIIGDAMMQEQRVETIEGMAEYAGLSALGQISRKQFMEEMQGHLTVLRSPKALFDILHVSRSVGCLICFALKSLGINFHHKLPDNRTIYEFIPQEQDKIEAIFNERVKNGIYC